MDTINDSIASIEPFSPGCTKRSKMMQTSFCENNDSRIHNPERRESFCKNTSASAFSNIRRKNSVVSSNSREKKS